MNRAQLASKIDHTLLTAQASPGQVAALVDEALRFGFASVCVNPVYAAAVRERLDAARSTALHDVKLCVVTAFPLGAVTPMQASIDATQSVKAGADEIDLVPWLPRLLNADLEHLRHDLLMVVKAVRTSNRMCVVKVILESAALRQSAASDDNFEAMIACGCAGARESGCDFIKTSTGFHPAGGATLEAVTLMKKHADGLQIKAAGGIRDYDAARAMLDAGADRLGTSASVAIVEGASS